ncbi:MAG: hydantoinase B/oxoprolinase family protein [Alphaproteobacteria bacterium]|jgi:N-methylhydantoinase B|nr:hydantoinase B/oxoprolinase family protein [Alphaproteobacteria bacterium]MDP6814199.1 hydantoinase B/oxoprolinase family protein [Alphaproteobacteria bacterium]
MPATAPTIDPVTLEVLRNKLDGIANEMQSTLLRSSFSPIVKEGLDASASLFSPDGETLAQSISIPIHLATLIPVVRTFLREFPLKTLGQDDLLVMNDPYLGGTHLPDIAVMMPIFHRGRPIALSAAMTHHQDVGGMTPGSVPTHATEVFQEGVRIPPLKLRQGGVMNDTFIAMMRRNVRMPDAFIGDLNAQIAACTVGARRLVEVAERHGADTLATAFTELLDRSEMMTRQSLAAIPDGSYRYTDYLDNDGIDLDRPIRICATVTVANGEMTCGFEGTSPQVRGPFNCVPSGTAAAALFAVRAITDPEIPTNGGCFRPVHLDLPADSLVNPSEPAPVNSRTATIKRITGCILGALKDVLPDRIPADSGGELLTLQFGGRRRDGSTYVVGDLIASGSGASDLGDGVDMIETDATNCMNLPVEALELEAPIKVHRFGLRPDSGGAGRHRGGLGGLREFEVMAGEVTVTYRGERHDHPAAGARGGEAGAAAAAEIQRRDGAIEAIPSKQVVTLMPGDRLIVETAGGGGHGPAAERDPAAEAADLRNGKVSPEAAARQKVDE